jgi:hypothetical protein
MMPCGNAAGVGFQPATAQVFAWLSNCQKIAQACVKEWPNCSQIEPLTVEKSLRDTLADGETF